MKSLNIVSCSVITMQVHHQVSIYSTGRFSSSSNGKHNSYYHRYELHSYAARYATIRIKKVFTCLLE